MSEAGQDTIHDDIARLAAELHRIVGVMAIYPPEVGAVVIHRALKGTEVRGKRRRRLTNWIVGEVRALRLRRDEEAAAAALEQAA
ncbi:MAG: hypothetical protein LCH88_05360 [Proteobacteria bacterium]|nr:hypothetical protein [Pseudomonadota bacterium]